MPPPDPDLTPAQERAVRARLADARHDEPVPDDVAGRLDATLAGLVADRDAAGSTDRVVELRSRRRRVTTGLLAAAVVVVVGGVVTGQVVGDGASLPTVSGSAESAGDAGSAAESDAGGDAAATQRDPRDRGGKGSDRVEDPTLTEEFSAESDSLRGLPGAAGPIVDPDAFAADAARLRARAGRTTASTRDDATSQAGAGCRISVRGGRRVSVTYDGQPGVLVYRAPQGGRQRVELHLCGSSAPRRVAEIPAP